MSRSQQAPPVIVSKADNDGVAEITLNRPDARNALSLATIDALAAAVQTLGSDTNIRAIVLSSTGRAFSAGHDLKELNAHRQDADGGRAYFTETMTRCADLMCAITACPVPVIAAVQGVATAAGCQLVAACDLAFADRRATFQTPGVHIGLFCSTPMVALSRAVPRKHALDMLLTGAPISADVALSYGLINAVADDGEAVVAALRHAKIIASKSRHTVSLGKKAFYRQIELPMAEAYREMATVMVDNMMSADAQEGIHAFLNKSTPTWSGE